MCPLVPLLGQGLLPESDARSHGSDVREAQQRGRRPQHFKMSSLKFLTINLAGEGRVL